jgi:hypothetical protein
MAHVFNVVIVLLAISLMVFSLTFASVGAQTIPIPELKPKAPELQDDASGQSEQTEMEPEPARPTDFAMKVQLEPHEEETLRDMGYY